MHSMTKYNNVNDILLQMTMTMMTSPLLARVEIKVVREAEVCQHVEVVVEAGVELRRLLSSPRLGGRRRMLRGKSQHTEGRRGHVIACPRPPSPRISLISTWDLLVEMTNRNAAAKRRGGGHKGVWHPVDRAEMQAFIGLIIATGITRLPRMAMYWETGHPLTGTPGFANIMSRDRFLQLLRYLHANDESLGNADNDKLYKVREFTNHINRNFSNNYSMGCNISIDESLIPFKGRLCFKQFIPSKRARFGIKCWVLADASNSFVSRFTVYTGREANVVQDVPLSTRVVQQLVEGLENLNHHLYVDNFYMSSALFSWLLERKIFACGTVRKGRVGFPKELYFSRGRHDRGSTDYRTNGDQLAQSWFDNKGVYFLSTMHTAEYPVDTPDEDRTVRRRAANGVIDVVAPPLLHDYNHYMG